MSDFPDDITKAACEVCKALGIASTPANAHPIMYALMAVRQQNERIEAALTRQTENMAFVLNHSELPEPWYQKFKAELEQDREHLPATPIIEDAGSGA